MTSAEKVDSLLLLVVSSVFRALVDRLAQLDLSKPSLQEVSCPLLWLIDTFVFIMVSLFLSYSEFGFGCLPVHSVRTGPIQLSPTTQ